MRLRKEKGTVWFAVVYGIIGIGSICGGIYTIPAGGQILTTITLLVFGLTVVSLAFWFCTKFMPPLYRLDTRKLTGCRLIPVYYSRLGPKDSDAVVCLVRHHTKARWSLNIVPLSAFSPEDSMTIRDQFSMDTGRPHALCSSIVVGSYKSFSGHIVQIVRTEDPNAIE